MNRHIHRLRNSVAQACQLRGVPIQRIWSDFGFEEVLIQAAKDDLDARELAVLAIQSCCCTDGKWNNCTVAFLGIMQFLKETFHDVDDQAFADLATLLKSGATGNAIQKWMDSH